MDFSLNEEQRALQESARQFATRELGPAARAIEDSDEPPSRAIVQRFAELGYLGLNLDPDLGGGGASHLDAVLVLEEIAKVSPSVAFPIFESCFGPVLTIQHFASDALKRRLVPKVCSGEMIIAASMSEPDAGTALTDLRTRAVRQGDTLVLNGQKRWCSGAGHADGYVVYCRLSDEPGARGIGAVYVDKGTPGLSFGKRERLMGFRGVASADIFLDDVTVPVDHVVAPAGGFPKLMTAFDLERCGNATMSLALAQSALDHVLAYVQERRQFGKPIVDFQAVQIKLADMAIRVDAARLLIHRAVTNASGGLPSSREASTAKCFANEIVRSVCGDAMQLMGGYGYAVEYGMERRFRDAWGWGIAGGAIDIQKINIASALVGRRFNQRG